MTRSGPATEMGLQHRGDLSSAQLSRRCFVRPQTMRAEDVEAAFVVMAVTEIDQRLVAAPVVPAQHGGREAARGVGQEAVRVQLDLHAQRYDYPEEDFFGLGPGCTGRPPGAGGKCRGARVVGITVSERQFAVATARPGPGPLLRHDLNVTSASRIMPSG